MFDLIIRNGSIVDGTGAPAFKGDVAITDGLIVEIGQVTGEAREEIDATGAIVTPGFVDVHSHYDGQATWDDVLAPSSDHGVTTTIMGNCGVGFAPVRPGMDAKRQLIELMEGVEDIPGTALWEGIDWTWESFPEYLDALGRRNFTMDVGALVPHGAIRAYVMGERGVRHEAATPDDIALMSSLAAEGVRAGAFGFSTSRVLGHQSMDGSPVPGTFADVDELTAIGRAVAEEGGAFELVAGGSTGSAFIELASDLPDEATFHEEIQWLSQLSRETGMQASYLLMQTVSEPDGWRKALEWTEEENRNGAHLRPQVGGRSLGFILSWEGRHMFSRRPTYRKLADLPFEDRIRELSRSEIRQAILSEKDIATDDVALNDRMTAGLTNLIDHMYKLEEPVNYEPTADMTLAAIGKREGVDPLGLAYDIMLENGGRGLIILPSINYAQGSEDALHAMLTHPDTVIGLADGGAHCSVTCDGSVPTYMLSHWAKGRKRGPRMSLEDVVRMQTRDTAGLYGLDDRGVLAVGKRADINVIDFDRLALRTPRIVNDLPAGGSRLLQGSTGYLATIVAGTIVRRNDEDTGARPGRLLRRTNA